MPRDRALKIKVQLYRGEEPALGPGRADVLDAIDRKGSIRAAGRDLGMSYRFIWRLVESMNQNFREKLVESSTGGSHGGGARLTDMGREVLAAYRNLEGELMRSTIGEAYKQLEALLVPEPQQTETKQV
jgi:molybdate transport system regulatory protein